MTKQESVSSTKPEPYHAEYLFWDYDDYQLEIRGANSEKAGVLSTDVTSRSPAELVQHCSWYGAFQRTW